MRSEHDLIARLRAGDEAAFLEIVERYHPQLIRLASGFVSTVEIAEDVAQETWLALLRGIDRFEERSALRTWLFRICINLARSIGEREHRTIPTDQIGPTVEAEQFNHAGAWTSPPTPWPDALTAAADDAELVALIRRAIGDLPLLQGLAVMMRDVDGLPSKQICQILSISEVNLRVLLHRGRARIRACINAAVISR